MDKASASWFSRGHSWEVVFVHFSEVLDELSNCFQQWIIMHIYISFSFFCVFLSLPLPHVCFQRLSFRQITWPETPSEALFSEETKLKYTKMSLKTSCFLLYKKTCSLLLERYLGWILDKKYFLYTAQEQCEYGVWARLQISNALQNLHHKTWWRCWKLIVTARQDFATEIVKWLR